MKVSFLQIYFSTKTINKTNMQMIIEYISLLMFLLVILLSIKNEIGLKFTIC